MGRAILTRSVIQVDIAKDPEYEHQDLVQAGFRTLLAVPMLREGIPIGAIVAIREGGPALHRQADRAARDLRRPGGHRHRERAPVQGTRSPDPGPDALGGRASGARRCRPGAQLDPRSGHGAPDHRDARQPAGRDRRLLRLRVRRGDRGFQLARATTWTRRWWPDAPGARRSRKGEGVQGRMARDAPAGPDPRHRRGGCLREPAPRHPPPHGRPARSSPSRCCGGRADRRPRRSARRRRARSRRRSSSCSRPSPPSPRWPSRTPGSSGRSRTRAGSSRRPAATSPSSSPTCPTSSGRR